MKGADAAGPAPSGRSQASGRRALSRLSGAAGLCAAALMAALALCGAETVSDGRRDVFRFDQYNHLILVASAEQSLRSGVFPPRVSPLLTSGLGNPYHQFYSPLAHTATAAVSIAAGDVVAGYSATVVLLLAFAFASMYRLGLYLTGSKECAAFAAVAFVTAPFLHADRTLLAAYAEYFALCLLPAVAYLNLRALGFRSYRRWALAAVATAALMLTHLLTAFHFFVFYALFLVLSGIPAAAASGATAPRRRRAFLRKALSAGSVVAAALLLSMYFMGPVLFYEDLVIKKEILGQVFRTAESGRYTPLPGLLGLNSSPWDWARQFADFSRLQAGFVACASVAAFALLRFRRGGAYSLPFAAVSALALLFAAFPSVLGLPVLRAVDVAEFSYRFLGLFAFAGALAGALALKAAFAARPGLSPALRSSAALASASLAVVLASPYLYPAGFPYSQAWRAGSAEILSRGALLSNEDAYLRVAPPDGAGVWEAGARPVVAGEGRPGDMVFRADLERCPPACRGPEGELFLGALYFPGLQDIEISLDGRPADFPLSTWWERWA
ncbi:MAG: hypothetical protein LBQ12_10600, partial [Deltaproteobacteria bacterium]|nr:hypothetical protein [Deltaproteobacteria bacterium]